MAVSNFNIEKLHGRENYSTWCYAIENLLEHEGLGGCIDGTDADAAHLKKAKAKIVLTVDPTLYVHFQDLPTAKDIWLKLKEIFADDGLDRRIGLIRQLSQTKLVDCKNSEEYVNIIMSAAHKLNNANLKVSSEWAGCFLLAGLPEEYNPMIMAMESSGIKISSDAVKAKLLQDIKNSKSSESTENALVSHGNKNKNKKNRFQGNNSNYGSDRRNQNSNSNNGHSKFNKKNSDKSNAFCTVLSTRQVKSEAWYLDSGASQHMTKDVSKLSNISQDTSEHITTANDSKIPVSGKGSAIINTIVNKQNFSINVDEVLYIPDLVTNLLSVNKICKKGNTVIFKNDVCTIYNKNNQVIATATEDNGLYKLQEFKEHSSFIANNENTFELWHRRLGHINYDTLKRMNNDDYGFKFENKEADRCITCIKGKQCRQPFPEGGSRAEEVLDLIHSDLCGPLETESIGASRFYISFFDDKSSRIFVYFIQNKSQALDCFKKFKAMVENQTGRKIKKLRTDNGKEYVNHEFSRFLSQCGIQHETTNEYTPEQNGKAERANRTIMDKTRSMLLEANLHKKFWAEAVNTAVFLINRTPIKGLNYKSPMEIWHGERPNLQFLRVFGSKAMVHIPKVKRKKLDSKSVECIMVGYGFGKKGWRLYNPKTNRIIHSRDVIFLETNLSGDHLNISNQNKHVSLDFNDVSEISNQDVPNSNTSNNQTRNNLKKKNKQADAETETLRRSERLKSKEGSNEANVSEKCSVMLNSRKNYFPQDSEIDSSDSE